MSKKDGGPAFPCRQNDSETGEPMNLPGVSVLDFFAAAALEGQLAAIPTIEMIEGLNAAADAQELDSPTFIAKAAYNYAEAMLAERERRLK